MAFLVGNSALRIDALGWDEVARGRRGAGPDARPACARRWRRGPSGSRPDWTTRPVRSPRPPSWRRSLAEAARLGGIYHTHVRYALGDGFLDPFREAIEIGRRSGGGPVHITHFYQRAHCPGTARPDDRRWSRTRAPRGWT